MRGKKMSLIHVLYLDSKMAQKLQKIEWFVYGEDLNSPDMLAFRTRYISSLKHLSISETNINVLNDAYIENKIFDDIEEKENIIQKKIENKKTFIYIDLDDTIFDFKGAFDRQIKLYPENVYPQSQCKFFENLEPLPRAIEVVKKLINDERYEVKFATAPSIFNGGSYSEKYFSILKHFDFENVDKLLLMPDKSILNGRNAYLIDDILSGRGQEGFEGNLLHFGSDVFPDWTSIESYFMV